MKTLEELKAKHAKEIADLEQEEAITSILPVGGAHIHSSRDHFLAHYAKDYPSRYTLREALGILDQFTPIECEHWKSGCLSCQPSEINSYAKEERATKVGSHSVEIKLSAGKGYDSHCLSFWTKVDGRLIKVEIDLQPVGVWLPQAQFRYHVHGNCTSRHVSPACIGEDSRRKWWSPEGSYQISYYWKDLTSFNATFRRAVSHATQ